MEGGAQAPVALVTLRLLPLCVWQIETRLDGRKMNVNQDTMHYTYVLTCIP
jgi:hypothetical protein